MFPSPAPDCLTDSSRQMPRMRKGVLFFGTRWPSPLSPNPCELTPRPVYSPLRPEELEVLRNQYEKEGDYVGIQTKFNFAWVCPALGYHPPRSSHRKFKR